MVKLTGIILAVIGCTCIGLLKASDISRRKALLLDFKNLIMHISTEISYFKEPLPQIFQRLSGENEKETGLLLRNCLATYLTDSRNLGSGWKDAVDFVYGELPVTKSDIEIMKKCGDFLGQSDFRGQQEHFALLYSQLDRQIEEAEEMIKTKGKMYSRLGLSAGCMIAVVLI